jgi:hypothetical protein
MVTKSKVRYLTRSLLLLLASVFHFTESSIACGENDPIEIVQQAFVTSCDAVQSAVGSGTFEQYVQTRDETQPTLRTKGHAKVYFDGGKYHLRLEYETMLVRTTYTDKEGKTETQWTESKPDRLFVIYDGNVANVVKFSNRIRPLGCEGEIYSELPIVATGFRCGDPARLGKECLNVERLIQKLGKESIHVVMLPDGVIRGSFRPTNTNKVHAEFDADPQFGFNVVALRIFNEGDPIPARSIELRWTRAGDAWFAEQFVEVKDSRRVNGNGSFTRNVFRYDSIELNCSVAPALFAVESTDLPAGVRFLDRR